MTSVSHLPYEIIYKILLSVRPSDIINFCRVYPKSSVMSDTRFWIAKLDYDYPLDPVSSSYVVMNPGDQGYGIYARFDDGYNGSYDECMGYINIIKKYSMVQDINYAIVRHNIKLLYKYIRYGAIPSQDAIDAACTGLDARHVMAIVAKHYKMYPSQLGVNWAVSSGNFLYLGCLPNGAGLDWSYPKHQQNPSYSTLVHNIQRESGPNIVPGRINRAGIAGYIDVLKWLINQSHIPTNDGINAIVANGQINSIKTLQIQPTLQHTNIAASNGQLDFLKWVHMTYNLLPTDRGIKLAKRHKHYHVIKWLRSK